MRKNDDTYGLGTETNYGHMALANNLSVANYQHGLALSSNQGKILNDKILKDYTIEVKTASENWVVPLNVRTVDLFIVDGGEGGGGGGGAKGNPGNTEVGQGGNGGVGGKYGLILGIKVTPGESIPIVIGAGGSGGNGGIYTSTNKGRTNGSTGLMGGITTFKNINITSTHFLGSGGAGAFNYDGSDGIINNLVLNEYSIQSNPLNYIFIWRWWRRRWSRQE